MGVESVPVIRSDMVLEHPVGPLDFASITNRDDSVASLHAFLRLLPIGSLKWDTDDGTIFMVYVHPGFRRKGIATLLLHGAEELAAAHGWAVPAHSKERTVEGDTWARAVGGQLPRMSRAPEPWTDSLYAEEPRPE